MKTLLVAWIETEAALALLRSTLVVDRGLRSVMYSQLVTLMTRSAHDLYQARGDAARQIKLWEHMQAQQPPPELPPPELPPPRRQPEVSVAKVNRNCKRAYKRAYDEMDVGSCGCSSLMYLGACLSFDRHMPHLTDEYEPFENP